MIIPQSTGLVYSRGAAASAWDLSTASYDSVSFSVSAQENSPNVVFFKPDGTKMYVLGAQFRSVRQYSLSTAWDLSTASYDSVSFSVNAQGSFPYGLFFKPDGTKMYAMNVGTDAVYQYSLSTAWSVSSASYDSVSFSVASQDTFPSKLFFKPDGTKMYISGSTNDTIYQYSLSTAWDLSTASYDSVSFSVASQDTSPNAVFFKDDGTKMYVLGSQFKAIYQYSLSTAWNVSTASYDSVSFSVSSEDAVEVVGLFFKDDGTKMYMLGKAADTIYQYSLG